MTELFLNNKKIAGEFIARIHKMYEQQPEFFKLSNGLRVVYLQTHAKVAHLGVSIMAGSRFEGENEVGIAHLLEHCLFKFPEKKKLGQVYRSPIKIEELGGELNAFTDNEEICVYSSISNEHISVAIKELAQIIKNTRFPKDEVAKEKEVVIDEINSYADIPSDKIQVEFLKELFKDHPLGNPISGTKESISHIGQAELLNYKRKLFVPENMVISYVGPNDHTKVIEELNQHFGAVKGRNKLLKIEHFTNYKPFRKTSKQKFSQSHVYIGGIGPDQKHKDRGGLTLLMNYLGGFSINSKLGLILREENGFTYNVEAETASYIDIGYWSIYFATDKKNLAKAIDLVYYELKKLCEEPINAKVLKIAKEQLKGNIALGLDSNVGLMMDLGKNYLFFNKIDSIEETNKIIDKISAKDLQEIANRYLHPEQVSELIYQ